MTRDQVSKLQASLKAAGFNPGPIDGLSGRKTTMALQQFLRRHVDSSVVPDGKWGPHTDRTYLAAVQQGKLGGGAGGTQAAAASSSAAASSAASPGLALPQERVRLVVHTASRKKSDFWTFTQQAEALVKDYRANYRNDNTAQVHVKSGRELTNAINQCKVGTIVSLDIVSHSSFGGVHISSDLETPEKSSWLKRQAHYHLRAKSDRPQTREDAEMMEEAMNGLYSGWADAKGVSYYFNQRIDPGTAYLKDIEFSRFAAGCFVELHGCRTAQRVPKLEGLWDSFLRNFSQALPPDSVMIGHTARSNPNSPLGYRHGRIEVYVDGTAVQTGQRERMKFPNSSTPGNNPELGAALSARARRSQPVGGPALYGP